MDGRRPHRPLVLPHLRDPPDFQPTLSGWQLLGESEADFRERARRAFARQLDEYVAAQQARAEAAEDRSGKVYRASVEYPTEDRFHFLAHFQVEGLSRKRIAKDCGEDTRTVGKWIEATAAEVVGKDAVGWWLRPSSRGGRPRKVTS